MKRICLIVLSVAQIAVSGPSDHPEQLLTRIAFGSCADQRKDLPIFDRIVDYAPQVFLFTGDNIYGDTEDMQILREKYEKLGAKSGFIRLRSLCPIIPAWDDHDYGENDAGKEYPMKRESQQVFADFFQLPADSPVRQRDGTYDSHTFGPVGNRVQIIVLDTRFFRSPLVRTKVRLPGSGPYLPNEDPNTTMLGESQWRWLLEQFRLPADVRVVVSSIQFIPNEHRWELWANFPHERNRMLELLDQVTDEPVIFITGDRHLAEISSMKTPRGKTVWDVTSSSLNKPGGGKSSEPNRHRISSGNYRDENFGGLEIDWSGKKPQLRAKIFDLNGNAVFDVSLVD